MKRRIYQTRWQRIVDFVLGFLGWFSLNGLFWLVFSRLAPYVDPAIEAAGPLFDSQIVVTAVGMSILCIPVQVNLGLLVFYGFRRSWIALGIIGAFAATLVFVFWNALWSAVPVSFF